LRLAASNNKRRRLLVEAEVQASARLEHGAKPGFGAKRRRLLNELLRLLLIRVSEIGNCMAAAARAKRWHGGSAGHKYQTYVKSTNVRNARPLFLLRDGLLQPQIDHLTHDVERPAANAFLYPRPHDVMTQLVSDATESLCVANAAVDLLANLGYHVVAFVMEIRYERPVFLDELPEMVLGSLVWR
jgi:hypothetical protein